MNNTADTMKPILTIILLLTVLTCFSGNKYRKLAEEVAKKTDKEFGLDTMYYKRKDTTVKR